MVSAGIHACLGRVRLEALGQLLRAAEGRVCPLSISSGVIRRRSRATRRTNTAGNRRSSRQSSTRVGTSGHAASGDGSPIRPRTASGSASTPPTRALAERPGRRGRCRPRTGPAPPAHTRVRPVVGRRLSRHRSPRPRRPCTRGARQRRRRRGDPAPRRRGLARGARPQRGANTADVAGAVDQDECAHPEASLRVPVSLADAVSLYGTTPWTPWTHRFDHASGRRAGARPRHPVQRRRALTIQARESNQTPSLLACAASVPRRRPSARSADAAPKRPNTSVVHVKPRTHSSAAATSRP
jgi:hypothetical protein